VGSGEVGKTSLLATLCGSPWVENRDSTHGIEIKPVTVKDKGSNEMLLLNGWDFGGQPVYRPTHQLFFSAPAVYLVVWKPREGLEAGSVEYWINLIKRRAPEAKILVVATHGGPNRRQPDIDEYEIINRFSRDTVRGFFRVDSKPDDKGNYIGIDDLKAKIAEIAAELPGVGDKVPAIWQEVRQTLQGREEAYLSYDKIVELCAEREMDGKETDLFLLLSHTLGHVIHYHNDTLLQDTVILKPDWLQNIIRKLAASQKDRDPQQLLESLNTEERAMLSQIDRQFAEFREDLADEAKEGPRLFSLKFVKPGLIGSIRGTQTKLQLTLWCEHSRQPLPVLNPEEPGRGVYELDLPRKWLVKAKPLLESIAIMLTPFHPVAGAMTRVFIEKVVYGAKQEAIETLGQADRELLEEEGREDPRRAKGKILRELHAFLRKKDEEKDPKDKFGGLMRVQNKRREFLWVHESFRDEYE